MINELGTYGRHMEDIALEQFTQMVHVGPSAVYKGTVRVETFCTLHLCPDTADMFADELRYYAEKTRHLRKAAANREQANKREAAD